MTAAAEASSTVGADERRIDMTYPQQLREANTQAAGFTQCNLYDICRSSYDAGCNVLGGTTARLEVSANDRSSGTHGADFTHSGG
jgi:hypothetical protein